VSGGRAKKPMIVIARVEGSGTAPAIADPSVI
jgi:hypothetical protein